MALGVFHCGAQNFDAIGGTADIDWPPAPIASDSKRTGRPVFLWRTVARASAYPFGATSSTFIATTSQPRNLLSIARLNIAKSRVRLSICSLVRIDHTCLAKSGGFAPISFPLFQGVR